MTLTQLRYLVAIVDAGLNITTAARRVNATQPGLSKQLKQIEEELGFLLFIRRGKSLEGLSAAGAQVVERARVILAEAANIRTLAANLRQEAGGDLRIATTHTQARFVLPPALAAFKKRFPEVRLHLEPLTEREALERLDHDRADVRSSRIRTVRGRPTWRCPSTAGGCWPWRGPATGSRQAARPSTSPVWPRSRW